MSVPNASARGGQPLPVQAVSPTSPVATAGRNASVTRQPTHATPLDGARTNRSGHGYRLPTPQTLVGQRDTLDKLAVQLQDLCKPGRLNFEALTPVMVEVREHKDSLQLNPRQQDSLTNKSLGNVQNNLLAVLEHWANNLPLVVPSNDVEDMAKVLNALGALIVNASTTVFENTPHKALALKYLSAIHAQLLDHALQLDLASARPSAVLSILNAISRGWKIGIVSYSDPKATALIAKLPSIAAEWKEESMTLRDLGKSFVQLSSTMAFTSIPPRSAEGSTLRSLFNHLSNLLGKISGHQGMVRVDDKTACVCIGNIANAFVNAIRHGYFQPDEIAVAHSLFLEQLAFFEQLGNEKFPLACPAAQLATRQLASMSLSQPAASRVVNVDDIEGNGPFASTEGQTATTTTLSTAPITTTTTTTGTPITVPRAPPMDAQAQRRRQLLRLQALEGSTPKTIIQAAHANGNFDTLLDSVNPEGDCGLKVLFARGKAKELDVLNKYTPWLSAIWNDDKARFGAAIDSLSQMSPLPKAPADHTGWLRALKETFDPTDHVHRQIEALLNKIDATVLASHENAQKAEAAASAALRTNRGNQAASETQKSRGSGQATLAPLSAGALKQLHLNNKDDLQTFFERCVAVYAVHDKDGGYVPKEIRALEIPVSAAGWNGEGSIQLVDLIQQYRDASVPQRVALQERVTSTLAQSGASARIRTKEPRPIPVESRAFPKEPTPSKPPANARARSASSKPTSSASSVSNTVWLLAHAGFGLTLGLYLVKVFRQPFEYPMNAGLRLKTQTPGDVEKLMVKMQNHLSALAPHIELSGETPQLALERSLANSYIDYLNGLNASSALHPAVVWEASTAQTQGNAYVDMQQFMRTLLALGACAIALIWFVEHNWRRPS